MPGFIGTIGNKINKFNQEQRDKLIKEQLNANQYMLERRTIPKFMNDKLFVDTGDLVLVLDGVILNNHDLIKKYKCESLQSCVVAMYATNGETFFNEFRGSFSGLLYDKNLDTWYIYTNHTGDKQVFYSQIDNSLLFASDMQMMVETLKDNNIPISLDEKGAYLVLTHGFVIEDHTLVSEVKKLSAGHYLRWNKNGLSEIQYHRFSNKPNNNMTAQEAIEGIDKYFRKAVKLQFEKDKEYGYKHLTTLSGGLDSRMTVWVAHQMGYTEQLNTTFSQSNYLDFSIAQEISTDLKHDFIFKALDHGNFIKEIDNVSELTYGNANFIGIAHGKSLYDAINFEPYGLVHTGMIGDAIIGTFFRSNEYNKEVKLGQGAYSLELIERLNDYKFKYDYENEEIFMLYTRAFTGANQGMVLFQEYTETMSPFCDVEFIEFCYSIPLHLRFNHKIYFDWIFEKYPGAAEYIWEKRRSKIARIENKELKYMTLFGKKVPAIHDKRFKRWLKGAVLRQLGLRKRGEKAKTISLPDKFNMNPVDYWYNTNDELKEFIAEYWSNNKHLIRDKDIQKDLNDLFEDSVVVDKLQILSFLSANKSIF